MFLVLGVACCLRLLVDVDCWRKSITYHGCVPRVLTTDNHRACRSRRPLASQPQLSTAPQEQCGMREPAEVKAQRHAKYKADALLFNFPPQTESPDWCIKTQYRVISSSKSPCRYSYHSSINHLGQTKCQRTIRPEDGSSSPPKMARKKSLILTKRTKQRTR